MNPNHSPRYAIISPVRDEEAHLTSTIKSVIDQTIRPVEWIIVNDGSTDRTGAIIDEYARELPWIRAVHRSDRGCRRSGSGVMDAFYDGYDTLETSDWDFLVKLDGDLSFDSDYFERCFELFRRDPQLGIGGGRLYTVTDGRRDFEPSPNFHVRGATKIYRRECWDAMEGLWHGTAWDIIDDVKANMLGWRTRTFPELELLHQRPTGAADGLWKDRIKHGLVCYISGYHPIFVAASCAYRLWHKPYISGAIAVMWGFLKGYLNRTPRVTDRRYVAYIRSQQVRRLLGKETIWR